MKKLLMKWFPGYFNVVQMIDVSTLKQHGRFELTIVNPEEDRIDTCLGITEERADELIRLIHKEIQERDSIVDVISEVGKHCVHINESVWCTMQIRGIVDQHNRVGSFIEAISNIGRG